MHDHSILLIDDWNGYKTAVTNSYPFMHHEPFCPMNEKLPAANHRSFASFTRCAAAERFVNSNPTRGDITLMGAAIMPACSISPWTGVTVSDVAVPDVWVPFWAARVRAAVRSLFVFDILAERRSSV